MSKEKKIKARLEELRKELRAERISYGELAELQALAPHIAPEDVELLEAAGVPEALVNSVNLATVIRLYEIARELIAWENQPDKYGGDLADLAQRAKGVLKTIGVEG